MSRVYLSLGSNLGNRFLNITNALLFINRLEKCSIIKISSFYDTEPYKVKDQSKFLNVAVEIETQFDPFELHKELLKIETELGRNSKGDYKARVIDIDILFFDEIKIQSSDLTIPHSDLHNRKFVLEPLVEINPEIVHPIFKKKVKELLSQLEDNLSIIKLS